MSSSIIIAASTLPDGLHWRTLLLAIYGLFLIIGGVIGYAKAKSLPSLIAGGVSGILAIILSLLAPYWIYTPYLALLLAVALTGIMTKRYLSTKKAFPALPIVIFSLVVAVAQVYLLLRPATHH